MLLVYRWLYLVRVAVFAVAAMLFWPPNAIAEERRIVFPIPRYNDVITFPVKIAGEEHLFAIDSGLTGKAVHTTLIPLLNDYRHTRQMKGGDGEPFYVEVYSSPEIKVGAIDLNETGPVVCFDMLFLREAAGRDIEGVLGMPFFRRSVIQMDFDRNEVVILPATTKPSADWGQPIPLHDASHQCLSISADFGGGLVKECMVDTGDTAAISFPSDVFDDLVERELIVPAGKYRVAMFNGVKDVREGQLKSLKIGDFESRDLLVRDGSGSCTIGLRYLRRFRVTFDFGRDRIYLAKRSTVDAPEKSGSIGIGLLRKFPTLLRDTRETVVSAVDSGGTAEKAGLRVDDRVLAIDGEPIDDKPIMEIRFALREKLASKGAVEFLILRGGKEQRMTLNASEQVSGALEITPP